MKVTLKRNTTTGRTRRFTSIYQNLRTAFGRRWKLILGFCGLACLMVAALIVGADRVVEWSTKDAVFLKNSDVPNRDVAMVLGCSKYLANGSNNSFFKYRIECAAELFHLGKIKDIIVSGDNSRTDYDEPTDMRDALVAKGVPADRIYADYAGFSTLDSVIRAKKVFNQSRLIVISQEFHVRRAVYIGKKNDMDIIGVAARDVDDRRSLTTHLREYLARVKTIMDVYLFNRGPKFLGAPVLITPSA